jgi:Mg2+-importing ATPase
LKSRPSRYLFVATIAVIGITLILPFTAIGGLFKFTALQNIFVVAMLAIVILYVIAAEMAKRLFYRKRQT